MNVRNFPDVIEELVRRVRLRLVVGKAITRSESFDWRNEYKTMYGE